MNNILTSHGLIKCLGRPSPDPQGKKLRAYEPPSRNEEGIKKVIEAVQQEFDLKSIIPAEDFQVSDLKDKKNILVKHGRTFSIMTKSDYHNVRKKGELIFRCGKTSNLLVKYSRTFSIMTKSDYHNIKKKGELTFPFHLYKGHYVGKDQALDGEGTLTFRCSGSSLTGCWSQNHLSEGTMSCAWVKTKFIGQLLYSIGKCLHIIKGKYTCSNGSSYEGNFKNNLPTDRGVLSVNNIKYRGDVVEVSSKNIIDKRGFKVCVWKFTLVTLGAEEDNVLVEFNINEQGEFYFGILEHQPKRTPSIGSDFNKVLSRAITLSKSNSSWRQTMIFIFNDTDTTLERSFQGNGWGEFFIEPPSIIPPGKYASFHHTRTMNKSWTASQGFFSYVLELKNPIQMRFAFDTQTVGNNKFGGEIILPGPDGELPNGKCNGDLLTNEVFGKTNSALLNVQDRSMPDQLGIVVKLRMNNDYTSFLCVWIHAYDPDVVKMVAIPETKKCVDEKPEEAKNFFFLKQQNNALSHNDAPQVFSERKPIVSTNFYKKGTSASGLLHKPTKRGTSSKKDIEKIDIHKYKGTGGYDRFIQDHPSYFTYVEDNKHFERCLAEAESIIEISAGLALICFSNGVLCFIGEELMLSGISSFCYTWGSGSDFNWKSFFIGKGIGLAFGAAFQCCCIPYELSSYFIVAKRQALRDGLRKGTEVILRHLGDTINTNLVYPQYGKNINWKASLQNFGKKSAKATTGHFAKKPLQKALQRVLL